MASNDTDAMHLPLKQRIVDLENPLIVQARFSIFTGFKGEDFASLPAAYRGSLTGSGDLDLQMEITVYGPFTKAQLEQQCEKLPAPAKATYSARITVEIDEDALAQQEDV